MNVFRFLGDMAHLASILILLLKITQSRSAAGISFKSQALYLLVFVARYPDLFYRFFSLYNTIFFLASSGWICYSMQMRYKATWDPKVDTLRVEFLLIPTLLLSLVLSETITSHYLFALGAYRGLYILNWIWRAFVEGHHVEWVAVVAGLIQTALYCDFFYVYFTKVIKGKKFQLPA
ncbi:ER lumen protein retaining receptor [Obelidium mucronatum]|nr:ER lumen protein retaining receptor [Obelidium mucronatum]